LTTDVLNRDHNRTGLVAIFTAFLTVLAAGCGGEKKPTTYPVSGIVKFRDGKPATGFTVKLRATDVSPPFMASSKTDEQGRYSVLAAAGNNAVIVAPPPAPRDTDQLKPAERERLLNPLDQKFLDYDTSQLKLTVTADPTKNQFNITVWPPGR
jgi:hypothetical protein